MRRPMYASAARVRTLCASLLLVGASVAPAAAQAAAMGQDEAPVRWVDGRPMLKATLRAGEKVYFCNLLLDLQTSQGLFLHRNAAGSLRSDACDVEIGGVTLRDLPFDARRDTWLEGLTARFATELQQVPVAGILGLAAFGDRDLRLDGPQGLLKLLPATPEGDEAPPESAVLAVVPLSADVRRGLQFEVTLAGGRLGKFGLTTRDPFCWIRPALAKTVGSPDGVLQRAAASPRLDFARYAPFRPEVPDQASGDGGVGGAVLQQLVVTIQPRAKRLVVEHAADPTYAEVEAAYCRARYGDPGTEALATFVREHESSPLSQEAAQVLLERLQAQGGSPAATEAAGLAAIRTAPENGKGTAALKVLEGVATTPEFAATRRAIAEAGLAVARTDEDGNAAHKLRLELGSLAMTAGEDEAAYRHLLAAVFGMPVSGPANLQLGRYHERIGTRGAAAERTPEQAMHLERALGRYFLATLDMKNTGQEGLAAWMRVFGTLRGKEASMLAELQDAADGRVPSFQAVPREGEVKKTGRTVLVELFTGAMCPPCLAADVACDALTDYYDRDEVVVLQWHLPVPAPEPLVAPVSRDRAEQYGVRGTPTVVVAGLERVVGGGKVDAVPEMFGRYRDLVDAQLREAPAVRIEGEASLQGDRVTFTARASVPQQGPAKPSWRLHAVLAERLVVFPGSNGILFHHHVARGRITPAAGLAIAGEPLRGELSLQQVQRDLDAQVREFEAEQEFLVRPVQPDRTRLEVVCWIEDQKTGTVLQALALPVEQER